MTETPWKCEVCRKKFIDGAWFHLDGTRHVVAAKTYFVRETGRVVRTNIPPPCMEGFVPGSDDQHLGGSVEFLDGKLTTSNPEQQYWLDQRSDYISEAEWQELRLAALTPAERFAEREKEIQRLEAGVKTLKGELQTCGNGK
jgi:hypothetical protein